MIILEEIHRVNELTFCSWTFWVLIAKNAALYNCFNKIYFNLSFLNYFERNKICQTNANFYKAPQSLLCLGAYWNLKEFPDIDRKLSFKVYSIPSNLSWPYRLHLFRSPWGFNQTTEIRFGSPKFDCSLASDECLCDGRMDLLA